MNGYEVLDLSSRKGIELIDIGGEARAYVARSGVKNGILVVYTPHTTAGITINENADPDVQRDIEKFLGDKFKAEPYFRHGEGNSPAHVMSTLVSASETLIIQEGRLVLGTWQTLFFCEFDGPRRRRIFFKTIAG